ncbi:MAG: helicase-exonuclease AddAB subunit AddA [Oscillospiraceae bacterium]|nr:helicase-exonuclease AddAB subunit AddA [Oscillospiraceae bacterium]
MPDWTKPQGDAIKARTGPILVSAAAGSGKTAVLVERAIRLILDEKNPIEADRLLIVTFTNAAAAEMKERISLRLSALARENPEDLRLARQQTLLSGAMIGTIHAFCLDLIRQNFQHLPISQDFSPSDEGELEILRQDCARQVIENFYAREEKADFLALVELLSSGRDDGRLTETLLKLYGFARSHPFYADWLNEAESAYHNPPPVDETLWGRALLEYAGRTLDFCVRATEGALALAETDCAVEKAYAGALTRDLSEYRRCRAALDSGDWDEAVFTVGGIEFARLGALRESKEIGGRVKAVRERCKKLAGELSAKTLNATRADFAEDMADLAPKVTALFDLCRAFDVAFAEAKKRKKRLDFPDLEHFALGLLLEPDGKGDYIRSHRAVELSHKYGAVLVDEYQDVNKVQDLIFGSVSQGEANLFLVGDAKQSIYSFRLATPAIFLDRKENAFDYDCGQTPAKIILGENFRSRAEVTGAVNYLFSMLMSREMGEIDYGGEERLVCGAKEYPPHPNAAAEFLLLDAGDREEDEDAVQIEAAAIAARITRMIGDRFQVTDKEAKTLRPAKAGDFCILMRSPKGRQEVYVKALEAAGLPVWAQSTSGFLALREVAMVVSLLEAMDSPLRDISLAAALASPLFGFSDTDLAAIRLCGRKIPFYRALLAASEGESELAGRCREFLALFNRLRKRAAALPADRLIMEIYSLTGALAIVKAMPLGDCRPASLLLLCEYAADYHKMGYKGLSGFVGFITRLKERGGDLAPAALAGEGSGAVRIMSVHRSKGLEFPVVFLADTAKGFNLTDLHQSTQLHSTYGFACLRRDAQTFAQYPTIPIQAIRIEARRSILSEELRVLYVALTRAREKLIVTACPNGNLAKKLEGLAGELAGGKLSPRGVEEAKCPADWLMMALLRHPDGGALRELADCGEIERVDDPISWKVEIAKPEPKAQAQDKPSAIARTATPDPDLLATLQSRVDWRYPFENQTRIPAKLAVSALGEGKDAGLYHFRTRPRFMGEQTLTPAERGNAMHKFMQFSDYNQARDNIEAEAARMAELGFLSKTEADSLDLIRLHNFFHSALGRRIFAARALMRELRFLGQCGQDLLGAHLEGMDGESKVALQGVADCVFIEEDGAVILDYKTDRVQSGEVLVARYSLQLKLYREILGRALPVPVKECLIYSFALGKELAVALP